MKTKKIRIMLVDDQPQVLKGLKMMFDLEDDLHVIAEAGDGPTAIRIYMETRPDVVVMDLELPGMDGIHTTQAIRMIDPEIKIVMLSIHADLNSQARAKDAGVFAYVEKRDGTARLFQEIRKACEDRY
jgi:DNA-binding NarL/FixJ family response regulator